MLAMQALGGDAQSAYLLSLSAGGYAAGIAWSRARAVGRARQEVRAHQPADPGFRCFVPLVVTGLVIALVSVATVALAMWLPQMRPPGRGARPLPWKAWVPRGVIAGWGLAGLGLLVYGTMRGWRAVLCRAWLGQAVAAGLAIAVAAAQLLPAAEFTQQSIRVSTMGSHDLYRFSLEPFQLVELVWPNLLGDLYPRNTRWRDMFGIPGGRRETWVPSLYLGGLTMVLEHPVLHCPV